LNDFNLLMKNHAEIMNSDEVFEIN
jgi:hypothetical protein